MRKEYLKANKRLKRDVIMQLKFLNYSKYIEQVEKLYLESFPEEERFTFWVL